MSGTESTSLMVNERSILENLADGVLVLDREWRLTYLNRQQVEWFNVPKENVLGRVIWEVCPEWSVPEIQQQFQQALTSQTPVHLEYRCLKRRGWFELRLSPSATGITILKIDITARKQSEVELRDSGFRFQTFMHYSPISAWIVNEAGKLLYLNPIYFKTFSCSQDAIGKHISDIFLPEIAEEFIRNNQRVFETGKALQTIEYAPGDDGNARSFLVCKFPIAYDSGEKLLGGFAVDISEQKRVEAALRESEQHLRIALRTARLGSWQHDLTTNVLTCSDQCKANFGLPADAEFTHETLFAALHPEDCDRVQAAIQKSINEHTDYEVEERCFYPDGSMHWLIARGGLIFNDNGKPIRLVGVTLDITERKQFEESLKAANQRVSNILESITDAFVAFDQDWQYTYVNQEAAKLLGKAPEELLGKRWQDAFPELVQKNTAFTQQLQRVMTERVTVHFEGFSEVLNRWLETAVFPATDGISVFFRDISDRKQEEQRKALQYSVSQILSEATTLIDVIPTLLQTLCEALRWQVGALWSPDSTNSVLCCTHIWFEPTGKRDVFIEANQRTTFEPGIGLPGRIWDSRQPIWVSDLLQDNNFLRIAAASEAELRAGFGFPILLGDEFLGVIECFCDRIQKPDEDLLQLMAAIGRQVGQFMERKRTEAALRESEELFQSFMSHSPIAAFIKDESGQYVYVNTLIERLFDRPASELVGNTDFDWFPAEAIEQIRTNDAAVLAQNNALQFLESVPFGEHVRHFMAFKFPIRSSAGRRFLGGVSVDITERIQAETSLRQREEELRVITNTVPVLISFVDAEQRYRFNSKRYQDWFGRSPDEIQDKYLWEVLGESVYEAIRPYVEQALSGQAVAFENRVPRQNDGIRHVSVNYVPQFDEQGQVTGFVALVSDISDRKQAEAERERLLVREKAAREQAEAANRIKDEFLAVLSHELRSPLNPILGWSKLLQRGTLDEQTSKRALETIERNAKLQTQLIDDLLDVSRILRGKLRLNIGSINLVTVVESAIETVQLAAEAKQIQIKAEITLNDERVSGDATRLQQIVWNLLSNAVKFTPNEGRIDVCLNPVDSYAQIQVKDTGKGISPEFLPYVFDYFRQEDGRTTRQFGGLGLGLAIVRHLTELHGGTVHVESLGEGQGSTFTVRLPLMTSTMAADEAVPITTAHSTDLSHLRILVVDDDEDMRTVAQAILEQQGAQVVVARSAAEVLSLFDQDPPDIFISDIGMPEVDGYMLMRQIRGRSAAQGGHVPAIALTAYAGEYDQQQALKAGFQQHIAKPVEPEDLVRAIANLVKNR
ncbi:MAG TPA: PAS domain-containing protein [Leptolyngbyaceae cyanobacterium]